MAIVQLQPDVPVNKNSTIPETIKEPTKSIFTSLVPETKISSLLRYIEGYPWTVQYYGQIVNKNNTLENFDPSTPNLTQPYYEVIGMIMQVSSALSSSYDSATGITKVTGSAVMPYGVTPNVGDVFIAKIDTAEDAIFLINVVERKTFRKDTVYEVNYSLYGYNTNDNSFVSTLQSRVQDTYYFNKDSNFFNRDVLVTPTVKQATDSLKRLLVETQDYYFSTFSQKGIGSILVPGTNHRLYDPLLINFIASTVEYSRLVDIGFFRHNYGHDKYVDQKSLYDVLQCRNEALLRTINRQYTFADTTGINNLARLGSIVHTGADYLLYPLHPNTKLNINILRNPSDILGSVEEIRTENNYYLANINVTMTINNQKLNKPLLHELFDDNYYLVSKNFYDYFNDIGKASVISFIEFLLYKYIKKEVIAKQDLCIAIQSYMQWSPLHQLFLLPLLWLLIKTNL